MTKNELNRFREILAAKVAELEPSSGNTGGSRSREAPINWKRYRRLPNAPSRFVDSTVASATFATRVRRFVRIEEGSFGTCVECDTEIYPKRLAAIPWAQFCIECQEAVDRNPGEMRVPAHDLLGRAA